MVSDLQSVRISRSSGNAYNLYRWADVPRVGLPILANIHIRTRIVKGGISSKCRDIGGELSVLQIPQSVRKDKKEEVSK